LQLPQESDGLGLTGEGPSSAGRPPARQLSLHPFPTFFTEKI